MLRGNVSIFLSAFYVNFQLASDKKFLLILLQFIVVIYLYSETRKKITQNFPLQKMSVDVVATDHTKTLSQKLLVPSNHQFREASPQMADGNPTHHETRFRADDDRNEWY